MTTEQWVKKLNALAWKIHEVESSTHQTAWPDLLRADCERWKSLARSCPR